MENNDRPKLTVVKGGKGRTGNRTTPSGLTEKQERFAQCLAEGMTLAEAYRQSYDCSTMALATIHFRGPRSMNRASGMPAST